jgi:hypothetical protein
MTPSLLRKQKYKITYLKTSCTETSLLVNLYLNQSKRRNNVMHLFLHTDLIDREAKRMKYQLAQVEV